MASSTASDSDASTGSDDSAKGMVTLASCKGQSRSYMSQRLPRWARRAATGMALLVHVFIARMISSQRDGMPHALSYSWILTCWILFECTRADSAHATLQASATLFLEWSLVSALALSGRAHDYCGRASWLDVVLWTALLGMRHLASFIAVRSRLQLLEGAYGKKLGSGALPPVIFCGVAPLWMLLLATVVTLQVDTSAPCSEWINDGYILRWIRVTALFNITMWFATACIWVRASRIVRSSLVDSMAHCPGTYACHEAAWAYSVITFTTAATAIFCLGAATVSTIEFFSDLPDRSSLGLSLRCCVYSTVDLLSVLAIVGFFRPSRPDLGLAKVSGLACTARKTKSLLSRCSASRSTEAPDPLELTCVDLGTTAEQGGNRAWDGKVREMAYRSIDVGGLLDMYFQLGAEGGVMPHFDPQLHTTNDVVRQAIIPLTRDYQGGGGRAWADAHKESIVGQAAGEPPEVLVTHDWRNLFLHLVAAVVADALGLAEYSGIATLLAGRQQERVRGMVEAHGTTQRRYWICAFCVNQHSSICGRLGREPPQGSPQYQRWRLNSIDPVTGEQHPVCCCSEPKVLNDSPDLCELNKFHDVMATLQREKPGFRQLVAVDRDFDTFSRLWCVAELVQAFVSDIPQSVCLFSGAQLDVDSEDLGTFAKLANLTVLECSASRPEDKEAILARIPSYHEFDSQLQALIFDKRGLLGRELLGFDILYSAGRTAGRMQRISPELHPV
mmetsp:Transcript_37313/g.95481  ORF Transcript_37313/g.95481 Transcript_37313/m.95481 type:complete len:731 (-) Transcript_37313:9-2201(-)